MEPVASPTPWAVEAKALTRCFGQQADVAVDRVDFQVREGEVMGIIGPDGAGKTTLIRMLVGVLAPTSGQISIAGYDAVRDRDATRLLVGYMSQAFSLYEDLTVAENISFFASLRRVPRKLRKLREERLLHFTRLSPFTARLAGALSGGMKQKLGLICTLVHEPQVLFMDEPTNGVDPVSRREFWDIVGELRGRVTVIVATPYMDEAERCDRVALMARGRFLAIGTPDEIRDQVRYPVWEIEVPEPFTAAEALRVALPRAEVQLFGDRLHVLGDLEIDDIRGPLAKLGLDPRIRLVSPSLEDAYVFLATRSTEEAA